MIDPAKNSDLRRQAVFGIPRHLLMHVLCGTAVFEGIPEDAVVVNVGHDQRHDGIVVMIQHSSFEVVPFGELAPWISTVTFRVLDDAKPRFQFREFL